MIIKSKRLILRLFTVMLMAAAIGITYPGTEALASPASEQQCIQSCGNYHSSVQECYQQALCKRNCRRAECTTQFIIDCGDLSYQMYRDGCVACCFGWELTYYNSCKQAVESAHSTTIFNCDRLYEEPCPGHE